GGGFLAVWVAGRAVASFAANLIASERTPKYRTIWALTSVCAVFAVHGLETLAEALPTIRSHLAPAVLVAMTLIGIPLARSQAYTLIALPQERELALLEASLRAPLLRSKPAVFVIRPSPEDAPATLRFEDEFGSLSSDSDWVPVEMAKAVIDEHDPSACEAAQRCRIATGRVLPPGSRYDLVIDMHRLHDLRGHADLAFHR